MGRRAWVHLIAAGVGVVLAWDARGVAALQGRLPKQDAYHRLLRVEPMVGDQGPLSLSLRRFDADLRLPQGFDRVYRVAGSGDPRGQITRSPDGHLYARMMGGLGGGKGGGSGLAAVFPRSAYSVTDDGTLAHVPAGTTYYLGELPDFQGSFGGHAAVDDAMRSARAGGRVVGVDSRVYTPKSLREQDLRLSPRAQKAEDLRSQSRTPPRTLDTGAAGSGIITDDGYRIRRLAGILGVQVW